MNCDESPVKREAKLEQPPHVNLDRALLGIDEVVIEELRALRMSISGECEPTSGECADYDSPCLHDVLHAAPGRIDATKERALKEIQGIRQLLFG